MLVFNSSNKLQVVLSGNVTTNQADCRSSWRDIKSDGTFTPGLTLATTNNTTDVDIVPSPDVDTFRVVDYIAIFNKDTASITVTVKVDQGGTEYVDTKVSLQPNERLEYQEGAGWNVFASNGVRRSQVIVPCVAPSVLQAPHFATANLTATKTITSGSSFALYFGRAPRSLTSVQIRLRVTTAMATITWGEVGLAKGVPNLGGNPTLTVVGYADISATHNSTGQKSTTINVSSGQSINEGDDLWVIVGNSAATALVIRAQSIADDIQAGYQASAAQRPSLIVGTPTVFTIEGATTLAGWIALAV